MDLLESLDPDKWYMYEDYGVSTQIFCGTCMRTMVKKTQDGTFVDDEAIHLDLISEVKDSDSEPYQCDECLKQNEAYEELGEEDDNEEG